MKHTIKVVFGKEQVIKVSNNEKLTDLEELINLKEYTFKSKSEKDSFIKGLNEAIGWTDYIITEI